MTEPETARPEDRARDRIRRRRLKYRSWHRGTREMDFLLGGFADRHVDGLSAAELDRYEAILEIGDPQLFRWIAGREPVPPAFDDAVMRLIRSFKVNFQNID